MAEAGSVLRIGLLGGGVVGGGVVTIVGGREHLWRAMGLDLRVVAMCVRDPAKPRDFAVPAHCRVTSDAMAVATAEDVDVVVDAMGGVGVAREAVLAALERGKHVVTANKAHVARTLPEFEAAMARVAGRSAVGIEACVCGGMPIIKLLRRDFVGDRITSLRGVVNGTSNYVLYCMDTGRSNTQDEAVREAQRRGYAEADPSADLDGLDARDKAVLLARVALGVRVSADEVPVQGIRDVTRLDMQLVRTQGTVKLLAVVEELPDDAGVHVRVWPHVVCRSTALAHVPDADNAVEVLSEHLGVMAVRGTGAGRMPTAQSVVSDLVGVAQGTCPAPFPPLRDAKLVPAFTAKWYIRASWPDGAVPDKRGALAAAVEEAGMAPSDCCVAGEDESVAYLVTPEAASSRAVDAARRSLCAQGARVCCMPLMS